MKFIAEYEVTVRLRAEIEANSISKAMEIAGSLRSVEIGAGKVMTGEGVAALPIATTQGSYRPDLFKVERA